MAERVGPEAFQRQQKAIMGRLDQRKFLPRIACPTLVLCGRQDQITSLDRSEEMAAAIAGAKLVVVEECGHIPQLERPEAATAAMREWLGA
jgi:pimeloyl-ACP methyl ester carboxylesterase